jgi:uncharacterized membrane protein YhaH (DUF805 family)
MESFLKELVDNYLAVLKQFKVFTDRSGRKEFWMFVLGCIIAGIIFGILTTIPVLGKLFGLASFLYSLAIIVPSIAVGIRRLHDTDKTGWLMLLCLIPIVGGIIVLVLCALEGTPGKNQYGPKPK